MECKSYKTLTKLGKLGKASEKMEGEGGREEQKIHVVMVPWLAQGHINPFINLSKTLASHGAVTVSFLSTPVNISRAKARFQGDPIELLELALPLVDGLPAGAECTSDIKPEMSHLLHAAFGKLEKPFETLMRRVSPDFIIHDLPAHWAAAMGAKLGIPSLVFDVYSPVASSYVLSQARWNGTGTTKTPEDLTQPPPDYPSAVISWRLFEARQILPLFVPGHGGTTVTDLMWEAYQRSCGILIKSCFQEEEKYLQYLRDVTGKPVISVGPLMLREPGGTVEGKSNSDSDSDSGGDIVRWLDKQAASSVVFASFGSESFLSGEQINELASALEETGLPFLWSLRSSDGSSPPSMLLPEGFEGRTRERGIVVGGWVPQVRILSHPSVGCFVMHGGWSSVMEAWFHSGLPLVLLPLRHDQGLNCRQIAQELKAGLEVGRATEKGSFCKEDVKTAIREVMTKEEAGAAIRSRVKELRDVIVFNAGQEQSVAQNLVEHMRKVVVERKPEMSS